MNNYFLAISSRRHFTMVFAKFGRKADAAGGTLSMQFYTVCSVCDAQNAPVKLVVPVILKEVKTLS